MISLRTLYDDYIDRLKLTQEKNQFVYIVAPPTKVGRNNVNKNKFRNKTD